MKPFLSRLESRTLKTKLLFGFGRLLLVTLATGIEALYSQRNLRSDIERLYDDELIGVSAIKDVQLQHAHVARLVRMILLAPNQDVIGSAKIQLDRAKDDLNSVIEITRQRTPSTEGKQKLATFEGELADYRQQVNKVFSLLQQGKVEEAKNFVATMDFQRPGLAANATLGEMVRNKERDARAALLEAKSNAEVSARRTSLLVLLSLGEGAQQAIVVLPVLRKERLLAMDELATLTALLDGADQGTI